MPTIITLNDGTLTFTLEQPIYRVLDHSDVFKIAPSRGRDLTVAGADGVLPRDRRYGPLPVTITLQVNGRWNDDGTRAADPAANCREALQDMEAFLTAPPRRYTMTVDDGFTVLTGQATFEEQGRLQFRTPSVADTSLLFTVTSGRVEESS